MLDTHLPDPFRPAEIGGEASASKLEANASSLWRRAGDFDRWGLGWEAAEARRLSRSLRVRALLAQALQHS
jgi:hypothetical protein